MHKPGLKEVDHTRILKTQSNHSSAFILPQLKRLLPPLFFILQSMQSTKVLFDVYYCTLIQPYPKIIKFIKSSKALVHTLQTLILNSFWFRTVPKSVQNSTGLGDLYSCSNKQAHQLYHWTKFCIVLPDNLTMTLQAPHRYQRSRICIHISCFRGQQILSRFQPTHYLTLLLLYDHLTLRDIHIVAQNACFIDIETQLFELNGHLIVRVFYKNLLRSHFFVLNDLPIQFSFDFHAFHSLDLDQFISLFVFKDTFSARFKTHYPSQAAIL